MNSIESHLELNLLEKVRHRNNKVTARCPACAENGGDRQGEHLVILPTGKYACAAFAGDLQHRKRIFALVGVLGNHRPDPMKQLEWRLQQSRARVAVKDQMNIQHAVKTKRKAIIARYKWTEYDVWELGPQRIDTEQVESDPRWFLQSLFPKSAILWTGEVKESGQDGRYANRWQPCSELISLSNNARIGPMTTPAIWKQGSNSRSSANVSSRPYTVIDFDGFDGNKPQTTQEMQQHISDSLGIINWLMTGLHWSLAAIIWTGGKSLHAWFHHPGDEVLNTLRQAAEPLGIDAGLIGHPEHPCRLPGQQHAKTGQYSRVMWLQHPAFVNETTTYLMQRTPESNTRDFRQQKRKSIDP
jgi:hypothetical protein